MMENTSPTAFLRESLPVVSASVFPRGCQAIFAEIIYLSSSACKSPHILSRAVSEFTAPAAPCCLCGCSQVTDNQPRAWEARLGRCHCSRSAGFAAGGSSGCLERKEMGEKLCVWGKFSQHAEERRGGHQEGKGEASRSGKERGVPGFRFRGGKPSHGLGRAPPCPRSLPAVLLPPMLGWCSLVDVLQPPAACTAGSWPASRRRHGLRGSEVMVLLRALPERGALETASAFLLRA